MNFEELFKLLKELEIIAYLPKEKLYIIRYDEALTKLTELSEESEYKVEWVQEDKNYIYFDIVERDILKEKKKDAIEFFRMIGFIDICHRHGFDGGPSEAIDEYNNTVIDLNILAKKYNLYDERQAQNDVWYELYTLWPEMEDYFEQILYTTYK